MESIAAKRKSSGSSSVLAPGFRFHPTDEELVRYYLRRKVCGKAFRFDAISEIDIYKIEPWDLRNYSKLKSRDLEWYFFSGLDKKYGNGARTNRATEKGYWKTTGKDRAVYHKSQIVGMKKTLVYHHGRAPKGERSNWVMHEYKLVDLELERAGIAQEAYVLCRVFQKSGSGPKNGEQYGAPFVEEEWEEEDELECIPKVEVAEEVDMGDDAYLDGHDLEQILGTDVPSDTSPPPLNVPSTDRSYVEETAESVNYVQQQQFLSDSGERHHEPEQQYDNNFYDFPAPYDMEVRAVKHEYIGESSKSKDADDLDYLLDEQFFDTPDNLLFGNGGFLETDDLSNPIENSGPAFDMLDEYLTENSGSAFDMLDEYLTYFNADDNNQHQFAYDPSMVQGTDDLLSNQALLPQKELIDDTEDSSLLNGIVENNDNLTASGAVNGHGDSNDSSDSAEPSDNLDSAKFEADFPYPFLKKASHMLGSISAPPALASEFPSKEAALRLSSLSQPSSSVHVTAGMIQISNLTEQPVQKAGNVNIIVSFGYSRSTGLESSVRVVPPLGKSLSSISRGWFYLLFFWVIILSVSFKMGMCIRAK